jgi:hypothetical protein
VAKIWWQHVAVWVLRNGEPVKLQVGGKDHKGAMLEYKMTGSMLFSWLYDPSDKNAVAGPPVSEIDWTGFFTVDFVPVRVKRG